MIADKMCVSNCNRWLYEIVHHDLFAYKQLKVVAGQEAIYVKLKPGFECLLNNNDSSDDGKPYFFCGISLTISMIGSWQNISRKYMYAILQWEGGIICY